MNRIWTLKQVGLLKKLWPDTDTEIIAKKIGRSSQSVWRKAKLLGLKRNAAFIEKQKEFFISNLIEGGKKTRFEKGMQSYNKGKKMETWMCPEKIENTKATRFKAGSFPHNVVPIGYRRKGKYGYLEEKIQNGCGNKNFKFVHHIVYEQNYGPIPEGCIVTFKDGNILNFDPLNLQLKTKKKNLLDNQITDSCLVKRMIKTDSIIEIELIKNKAPELIEIKRATILLNRKIKENVARTKN